MMDTSTKSLCCNSGDKSRLLGNYVLPGKKTKQKKTTLKCCHFSYALELFSK